MTFIFSPVSSGPVKPWISAPNVLLVSLFSIHSISLSLSGVTSAYHPTAKSLGQLTWDRKEVVKQKWQKVTILCNCVSLCFKLVDKITTWFLHAPQSKSAIQLKSQLSWDHPTNAKLSLWGDQLPFRFLSLFLKFSLPAKIVHHIHLRCSSISGLQAKKQKNSWPLRWLS